MRIEMARQSVVTWQLVLSFIAFTGVYHSPTHVTYAAPFSVGAYLIYLLLRGIMFKTDFVFVCRFVSAKMTAPSHCPIVVCIYTQIYTYTPELKHNLHNHSRIYAKFELSSKNALTDGQLMTCYLTLHVHH